MNKRDTGKTLRIFWYKRGWGFDRTIFEDSEGWFIEVDNNKFYLCDIMFKCDDCYIL